VSSSNFVRWGGLAAVAGGALWMAVFALFASRPSGPGSAPPYRSFEGLYVPCLVSAVLVVAGLVALHAHLRGIYGGLGTAGFVLALVGAALLVLVAGGAPFLLSRAGALGFLLGSALMGAAALRASARLRWGARRSLSARWRSSCWTRRARGSGLCCRTGGLGWWWGTCCSGSAGPGRPRAPRA
jgi:hypothetical protein